MAMQIAADKEDRWAAREAELIARYDLEVEAFEIAVDKAVNAIDRHNAAILVDEKACLKAESAAASGIRGAKTKLAEIKRKIAGQKKARDKAIAVSKDLLSEEIDRLMARYESAWAALTAEAERDEVVSVAASKALENLMRVRSRREAVLGVPIPERASALALLKRKMSEPRKKATRPR